MNKLHPVFLFVLLAVIIGCNREDTLLPTTTDAGSYRMDGRTVSCQASATSGYILSSTDSLESISVQLNAPSEPSPNASSYLILDFHRSAGKPNAPYQLALVTYFGGGSTTRINFFDAIVATLQETSPGVVSGTFSDSKPRQSTISEGSFTNVHVKPPANVFQ